MFNQAGTLLANAVAKLTLSNGTVKSANDKQHGHLEDLEPAPGTYTVTVSLMGYATQSSTCRRSSHGKP